MSEAWLGQGVTAGDPTLLAGVVLEQVSAALSPRQITRGTVLARAGAPTARMFMVADGELELSLRTPSGPHVVAVVPRGGVVGDVAALCGLPMPVNAVATRESLVFECGPDQLGRLLASAPELSLRWMRSLARRLLAIQRHAVAALPRDLTAQVAALLLLEQEPGGDAPAVRRSQESIANLLGASRQSVSRALSSLRARELVRTGYRSIVLLDREALSAVAIMAGRQVV